jgi:NAD(P)-dependent dehydrogenase (short-subunit alcohol dehydrogenase family)
MMKRFENKICLVTGAASGIGKATAIAFAKEGAKVIAADISDMTATEDEIKNLAYRQAGLNAEILSVKCNIGIREDVKNLIAAAVAHFGRLDCAVNVAGIAGSKSLPVHEYPEDEWINQININLIGTYYCVKDEITQMLKNGGGNIVNVSSAAGLIAQPQNSPYAASKFGVVGLTRTAAKEYATQNIRINAICPTAIETPMIMEGRRKLAYNPEALEAAKNFQAMKRMGQPEEVANVILWLCSDESSFITGHAMPVDGGAFA